VLNDSLKSPARQPSIFTFYNPTLRKPIMPPVARLLLAALLSCTAIPVLASPAASEITLSASAQREVANDQLDAVLYLEEQQARPALLADKLNQKNRQALAIARAYPNVDIRSGASSSWPVYDGHGQIQHWQGRIEIVLNSVNFVQSAELIARLQEFMLLQSIRFSVSNALQTRTEQSILPEAIRHWQEKARIAALALGKKQLTVRTLNISQDGGAPRLQSLLASTRSAASDTVTPPDWQPGSTRLVIRVDGRIDAK
jgi:predicted secreted protein